MRKCMFVNMPKLTPESVFRWASDPKSASTWTKCSAGNSAETGQCTVNKSPLIDVRTSPLRQRSVASRNKITVFPHKLPMCVCASSAGLMDSREWIYPELTVWLSRGLFIQHLSSEWLGVNKNKKSLFLYVALFFWIQLNLDVFSLFWCSVTDPIYFQRQPLICCHRPFDEEQRR